MNGHQLPWWAQVGVVLVGAWLIWHGWRKRPPAAPTPDPKEGPSDPK